MTTIRQSNQVSVLSRLPTLPTLVEPPRPAGIGDALKDVFADSHSNYKGQLRGMDDKALACEGKRLQQVIRDASSGGDKNPGAVARAKAQYAEYKEEKCCRDDIAKGPDAAWAKKAHCMNDSQLGSERCRQLERYHEATTGYDRDPAKAADAKSKLSRLDKESFGRVMDRFQGDLPKATVTRPTGLMEHVGDMMRYQQMSPSQLASEKGQLNATLRDACSGAHRDVQLAANCRQKLELISHCESTRTTSGIAPPASCASTATTAASRSTTAIPAVTWWARATRAARARSATAPSCGTRASSPSAASASAG